MKNDFDDVSFSDGLSYMVARDRFTLYMESVGGLKKRREDRKTKENRVCLYLVYQLPHAHERGREKRVMSTVLSASRIILRRILMLQESGP